MTTNSSLGWNGRPVRVELKERMARLIVEVHSPRLGKDYQGERASKINQKWLDR